MDYKQQRNGTYGDYTTELLRQLDIDVPGYSSHRHIYLVGLFTLGSFAVPLNLAAGALLIQRHFWRSNVYILLFQLAIADLLVATFCVVGDAIWNWTIQWHGGDTVCRFYKFMQMFSLYASTFILTGISIDRCVAVLFPLRWSGSRGKITRVRILSATAWILAAVCASPQAVIFHTETAPFSANFKQCVTHGAYTAQWQEVAYSVFTVSLMFFVPMFIMIFCYVAIFTRITKEARLASEPANAVSRQECARKRLYSRARRTTLLMTLIFVICFIVCWAPYYVGTFCFLLQMHIQNEALGLIFCFGMCSSVINPIIYGSFNFCGRQPSPAAPRAKFKHRLVLRRHHHPLIATQESYVRNICDPYQYMHANDRHPRLMIKFKSCPNFAVRDY
ncbi:putative Gonadotropin-releasing hormone receptor [Hypsibius exemplaris]|uniref:Gonadotropin-releasing hormone receptor n=1 Tax=Hypsibius exemplaris TaxID=2072580 RepID=A0A9X6RKF6_HYPEX|nr:putative Gonadotropin-releasing hormone receptor [Hypsibius exemplaris]